VIVEVTLRVRVADHATLAYVASGVENATRPLHGRVVGMQEKFENTPRPGRPPSARGEAKVWLLHRLEEGPEVAENLYEDAAEEGIATQTLRRAADELGVKRFPVNGGKKARWSLGPARSRR
jgi:hypothetical protein